MGAFALVAAAAVTIAFRASLTLDVSSPDFNPIVAVPVLLAGYGILQVAQAYRARRVGRRFGVSAFEMQGAFVRRGGTLRGRILTARDLSPQGGFILRLRSIERRRLTEPAGDRTHREEDRILWEASSVVHLKRSQAVDDSGETRHTVDGLLWPVMRHEVRHTAQIGVLLRMQGVEPPSLDLLWFLPQA